MKRFSNALFCTALAGFSWVLSAIAGAERPVDNTTRLLENTCFKVFNSEAVSAIYTDCIPIKIEKIARSVQNSKATGRRLNRDTVVIKLPLNEARLLLCSKGSSFIELNGVRGSIVAKVKSLSGTEILGDLLTHETSFSGIPLAGSTLNTDIGSLSPTINNLPTLIRTLASTGENSLHIKIGGGELNNQKVVFSANKEVAFSTTISASGVDLNLNTSQCAWRVMSYAGTAFSTEPFEILDVAFRSDDIEFSAEKMSFNKIQMARTTDGDLQTSRMTLLTPNFEGLSSPQLLKPIQAPILADKLSSERMIFQLNTYPDRAEIDPKSIDGWNLDISPANLINRLNSDSANAGLVPFKVEGKTYLIQLTQLKNFYLTLGYLNRTNGYSHFELTSSGLLISLKEMDSKHSSDKNMALRQSIFVTEKPIVNLKNQKRAQDHLAATLLSLLHLPEHSVTQQFQRYALNVSLDPFFGDPSNWVSLIGIVSSENDYGVVAFYQTVLAEWGFPFIDRALIDSGKYFAPSDPAIDGFMDIHRTDYTDSLASRSMRTFKGFSEGANK
ncbi:hypothetical protein [Caballeronia concitans]|uniref:Uncharacterized protein n=1 Tax=Caballeronia concitans TaxID=1777133 RepID=A0A658R639_9BURK|nr:hypothetical protein [Caballeronia concitans]SAL52594.1 hypothetical protein AWB72_05615 [Caballeronia concitans]